MTFEKKANLIGSLVLHTGAIGVALWCGLMKVYLVVFLFTWANNLALRNVK